jgi:hypothetical protein
MEESSCDVRDQDSTLMASHRQCDARQQNH